MTVSSSLPWTGTFIPVLYGGCSALTVPPGVTLTLGAGTVVKGQQTAAPYFNVQGRWSRPVRRPDPATLTSWRDDAVGGDTNGDGNATGPLRGDWGGISAPPPGPGTRTRGFILIVSPVATRPRVFRRHSRRPRSRTACWTE